MIKPRKRPAIWIAEGGLIAIAIVGMLCDFKGIAIGAMTAIAATLHKCVESEEKGEKNDKD